MEKTITIDYSDLAEEISNKESEYTTIVVTGKYRSWKAIRAALQGTLRDPMRKILTLDLSELKGLPIIKTGMFYDYVGVKKIILPKNTSKIETGSFVDCKNLESLTIQAKVKEIEIEIFGPSVINIARGGFTPSVINIAKENPVYDSRNNCNAIIETKTNKLVVGCKGSVIPDGVSEIGRRAFSHCPIEKITVPSCVKKIGKKAFYNCESLKEIELKEGLESIEEHAFKYCSALKGLEIPASVKELKEIKDEDYKGSLQYSSNLKSIIEGCGSIEHLKVAEENKFYDSRNNCNAIIETKTGRILCVCANSKILEGRTKVPIRLFRDLKALKSIEIPKGVKKICEEAFNGCSSLVKVTLPEGLIKISRSAFSDCGLENIKIPESVERIGEYAFSCCESLTNINIPAGIKIIKQSVFERCKSLESINIPDGVIKIEFCAFRGAGLKSITIPGSVKKIGVASFAYTKIETLTILDGVEEICTNAFGYCYQLKSITLPKTLKTIGEAAFQYCTALEEIIIPDTVKEIMGSAFEGCRSLKIISVAKTTEIYSTAFNRCSKGLKIQKL